MVQQVFGAVMVIVQTALLIPLLLHAWRRKSIAGVSVTTEALWSAAGVGWLVYGLGTGSLVLVASGALAFLGSFILLALVRTDISRSDMRAIIAAGALMSASMVISWFLSGASGLGVVLAVFGAVQFLPQLKLTLGSWRESAPGVSPHAAGLRALYTGGWAAYAGGWALLGLTDRVDWPLVAWGLAGVVAFSLQAISALFARK